MSKDWMNKLTNLIGRKHEKTYLSKRALSFLINDKLFYYRFIINVTEKIFIRMELRVGKTFFNEIREKNSIKNRLKRWLFSIMNERHRRKFLKNGGEKRIFFKRRNKKNNIFVLFFLIKIHFSYFFIFCIFSTNNRTHNNS